MTLVAEKQLEHIGQTHGMADHDHDLVHELHQRLDAVWRYDQFIANAEDNGELQAFWREMKQQDQQVISRLRELIKIEVQNDCF